MSPKDRRRLDYFELHQTIETGQASLDVEVFDLPGEGKFAVFADDNTTRSGLYRWENDMFLLYQTLPTLTAQSWEFFEIKNQVRSYIQLQNNKPDNDDDNIKKFN